MIDCKILDLCNYMKCLRSSYYPKLEPSSYLRTGLYFMDEAYEAID